MVVASGESYPDAISGDFLSGVSNSVILLTYKNMLPSVSVQQIKNIRPKTIYLLGGKNTVSQNVENELKKYSTVKRVAGKDRYETSTESLNIATKFISKNTGGYIPDSYIVSTGKNFITPLISSAICFRNKFIILAR